jgi:TolA-binding protein
MTEAAMKSRRRRCAARICAIMAAAALAGCAASSDVQQLQESDSSLRGMIATDRQQIADLQEQVNRLNDQLVEMRHNGGAGKGPLSARVARLEQEVAALKQTQTPAAPGAAGVPGAPGMPPPGASVGGAPPIGAPMVPPGEADAANSAGSAAAPPAANPPPPAVPQTAAPSWRETLGREVAAARSSDYAGAGLYRAGLSDMQQGNYANALAKFQGLQRRYPKSELSEPAEYFSAVALNEMGKYDQAILQYNDLAMRFPSGRFAAASLLGEAQAFMKINDRIDARLTLQKLLNDHPNSPQAPSARAMLASLANG